MTCSKCGGEIINQQPYETEPHNKQHHVNEKDCYTSITKGWNIGTLSKGEAKRNPTPFRYDILDPSFLRTMAEIGHYGAEKYGELNWQKSRLTGEKGPVNHMYKHLGAYQLGLPYDHKEIGEERRIHLAAIAFNALMEYWYECHPEML
jgi:hypothetical protein